MRQATIAFPNGPPEAFLNFTLSEAVVNSQSNFEMSMSNGKMITWCVILIKEDKIVLNKTSKGSTYKVDFAGTELGAGKYTLVILPIRDAKEAKKVVTLTLKGKACTSLAEVSEVDGLKSLAEALKKKAASGT